MSLNPTNLPHGHDQYEYYRSPGRLGRPGKMCCQYDYRSLDGTLFSCVAPNLDEARERRNVWLEAQGTAHV